MGDKTAIEWTATVNPDGTVTPGSTWNPVRGCSRVSPGCERCYAERLAGRFSGPGQPYAGFVRGRKQDYQTSGAPRTNGTWRWTGKVELVERHLEDPLRWQKPRRVFVNSMSDLFHEDLPDRDIDRVFAVMALAPRHTFQLLTKRAERMHAWMTTDGRRETVLGAAWSLLGGPRLRNYDHWDVCRRPWPLPNVWLGVSTEDQQRADERVPWLLETPAAVRFVSVEPLLGSLSLADMDAEKAGHPRMFSGVNALTRHHTDMGRPCEDVPSKLDWVIVGAESGPHARPMNMDWVRALRDECTGAGVAFFLKQAVVGGRKVSLPVLDGRQHKEFP